MDTDRVFSSSHFFKSANRAPARSVVAKSLEAIVVAWQVDPGQSIPTHIHPDGQDTWTVSSGKGDYYLDDTGTTQPIVAGDVVIAHSGQVHGVVNSGDQPLTFISVVTPANAGHQVIALKDSLPE